MAGQFAILVVLICFSAFFSGIETALMSLNKVKVNALLKQKKKGAVTLDRIKKDPHRLIITILIGNNIVNIGAASLATVIFTELFGSSGVGIATGVMTFLILVFGEITPKTYATQNAEKVSLKVARPVELLSMLLYPFVKIFSFISHIMSKILGSGEGEQVSEEELRAIVTMGAEEGLLDKEAAEMMHNILEFRDTKVTDVMTPKVDMEKIDGGEKLKDVLNYVVKTPYSRYPVFSKDDKVVGILDVDDVLRYAKNNKMDAKVSSAMREAYIVPETKEIDDLLAEFEGKHVPMAIVVDEYGEVSGVVTVEDILEEIVGDIFDKSKKESIYIKKIGGKVLKVDAKIPIEEVNKSLNLELEDKHFDTLAGFIEHKLQRIPKKGEKIALKKAMIEIVDVTKQKINSVKILKA